MVKIRVTCGGCGIEYTDEHGNVRYVLKTEEDGPFSCDEAQAERLISMDVATYATEKKWEERKDGEYQDSGKTPDAKTGHLSAEELEKWDMKDLRELAADIGVKPEGKKKADYIDAIISVEVVVDEIEDKGDDEIPNLGAVDPE